MKPPTFSSGLIHEEGNWSVILGHFERQGIISKEIPDGYQQDTYTGFPYDPIQIDSRYGYPTASSLNGFPNYLRSQPNICGNYSLSEDFTPSHFNGIIALKALNRLVAGDLPFFLTVSFHNPHPPMVPAWKHLEYYWENRQDLFIPESIDDRGENSDYGSAANTLPKYGNATIVQEWTATYYALVEEIDEYVGLFLDALGDSTNDTLIVFTSDHGEMLGTIFVWSCFYHSCSRSLQFSNWFCLPFFAMICRIIIFSYLSSSNFSYPLQLYTHKRWVT